MMKEKFARWHVLYFHYLRRDWKKILIWVMTLGFFAGGYVPIFEEMASGQGLIGMYETLKNPAMISMVGPTPIKEASAYTLGAMYAHEMLLFCGLFAMIISALHVVSRTRKEEERGLLELVRSYQVGREANSMAVMVQTLMINLLLGLLIAVTMMSFNAETVTVTGSILFAMSISLAGLIGGVLALVMAQVNQSASGASGSTLAIIGTMYILRGMTDIGDVTYSMVNPMGWTYLTYPFTDNNFMPLVYGFVFIMVMTLLAFLLEGRRDMGAGYLPVRAGRAHAKKSLLSLPGLFIRLNKGIMISWHVAFIILGAAYGSIYGDMQTFLEGNDLVAQMFTMIGTSIESSFTSIIIMVMVGLVCVLPIAIVNKLFTEEERQNLSQIYATRVTRRQLYVTTIGLAIGNAVLGIFLSVIGLGVTALSVLNGKSDMVMEDFIAAGFNFFPATIFFIGLAALILGFAPRFGKVVYIYLAYSFAVNYFGGLLKLPDIFKDTAVLSWLPRLPVEAFEGGTFFTILAIGIVFIGLGFLGYNKRDRIEGA